MTAAVQARTACGCACSSGAGGCGGARDAAAVKGPRTAYIALGSNLGDRVGWIEQACAEMNRRGIKVKRTSSLWETEPMYVLDQDRFVNGACEVSDTLLRLRVCEQKKKTPPEKKSSRGVAGEVT